MRAPFPWFGGKSLAAPLIWRAFGNVPNYVEPFAGSLAVLLARPGGAGKCETANDKDGLIANFWRAVAAQPDVKTFPARDYLNGLMEEGIDVVNAVGIRRAESDDRAKMPEWEWMDGFDCEVWRPLVDWTIDDVIAIHKRHDVKPNPLYLMGMDRVGCWPCINSNKRELRRIAELTPEKINELRDLEVEVGIKARARYDQRLAKYQAGGIDALNKRERELMIDEDGNIKPFHPPHFFQSPLKEEGGKTWPIDRVVAWSRTRFGGRVEDRQVDLLAFGGINDGCMRWGMCETSPPDIGDPGDE